MLSLPFQLRIFAAVEPVDFRKGFDGLVAIVRDGFREDPFAGDLFCFFNRRRDRVKILAWDRNGFWLHYKRLERGTFERIDGRGARGYGARLDSAAFAEPIGRAVITGQDRNSARGSDRARHAERDQLSVEDEARTLRLVHGFDRPTGRQAPEVLPHSRGVIPKLAHGLGSCGGLGHHGAREALLVGVDADQRLGAILLHGSVSLEMTHRRRTPRARPTHGLPDRGATRRQPNSPRVLQETWPPSRLGQQLQQLAAAL